MSLDYYDIAGDKNSKNIVFLHGGTINRKMWTPQMENLSDSFRLIAIDLPGHGVLGAEPFRFETAVQQVAAVISNEVPERCVLVGLSLGGLVAIEVTRKCPEKIAGLILTGSTVQQKITPFFRIASRALVAYAKLARKVWGKKLFRKFELRAMQKQYPKVNAEPIVEGGIHFDSYLDVVSELENKDFMDSLRDYTGKVLILNGEKDTDSRKTESLYLSVLHDGYLQVIAQAGHMANLDQPVQYSEAVYDFANQAIVARFAPPA